MSKKKNKKKNRNHATSWDTEIKKQYCAQGHGEAFQGEIDAALSKTFQERWGDDTESGTQRPLIAEVKGFRLEFETNALNKGGECRVCFRVPYIIDYHGIYAERHECVCFSLDTKAPEDVLVEKIREQEGAILEKIRKGVSQLPDVFPEAFIGDTKIPRQFAAVSFMLTQMDYRKRGEVDFNSVLAKIKFKKIEMGRAVSNELMTRIQKSLRSMETLPENVRPITYIDCVIDLTTDSIFSYCIIAKYRVFFKGDSRDRCIKISIPIPGLFPIFREKNAAARDDITAIFQREATAAFDRAYENLPYYRLEPPEILQSALNYGRQNGIQFGKIRAKCERILSGMEKTTFYPGEQDLIGAATWENGEIIREDNVLSLRKLEKKMTEPVKMKSKKGLPNDPISFMNFCKEAAALYDGFKDKRVPVMPDLTFVFNEEEGNACFCNKVRIDLSDIFDEEKTYEKTVRARVLDVFAHVADLEFARLNRAKEQAKILSELNPTELLILKHVSWEGKSWYSKINEDLEGKVMTTKVSAGPYLDHLCDSYIVQDGEKIPLLNYEWASSRKHGDFRLYRTPVSWEREALDAAVPRAFTLDDFSSFSPAGREWFFSNTLQACCDKESRWLALQVLEKMSAQFAADFAKTENGQKLFQSFAGDDAVYARFFLESLPGCKRLAAKYFPEP